MGAIGEYLLSIIATALLISLAGAVSQQKGPIYSIFKLISGLILIAVIVSPFKKFNANYFSSPSSELLISAAPVVSQGEAIAKSEMLSYITSHTNAYILDKASTLGLNISVDITLSEDLSSGIQAVAIKGNASPYAKQCLKRILCQDLGVSEEAIVWS